MLATAKRTLSPEHLAALSAGRARKAEERMAQAVVPPPGLAPWETAGPTRRMDENMVDDWFYTRLNAEWPGYSTATWRGRIRGYVQSNEFLPIYNDRAVLLAEVIRQPMTGKPIAWEVFAWSRDAEDDWVRRDKGAPLLALYRRMRRWMTDMGGEMMIVGVCSDLRGDSIARGLIEQGNADGNPLVRVGPYKR